MKTVFPQLIIRPQSSDEEMDYLWMILKNISFFREHNYNVEIPNHAEFQKLIKTSPDFSTIDKESVRNIFIKEYYESDFYAAGLASLEVERLIIEKAFPILSELNQKWGFKIFPQYTVALTGYGPGGGYDASSGKILMMTTRDGKFKRPHPTHTVVHEIIHMGIEENIVKRFKLTHKEKERLVDLIVLNKFGGLLNEYQLQPIGNTKIDPYVTDQSLNNLPQAIRNYANAADR